MRDRGSLHAKYLVTVSVEAAYSRAEQEIGPPANSSALALRLHSWLLPGTNPNDALRTS